MRKNVFEKPTQFFGKYGPFITLQEAYDDGHATGEGWKKCYRPGGPHVLTKGYLNPDGDWIRACDHSKKVHKEWLRGFDDARAGR